MIGRTCLNLETSQVVEIRAMKSAPSYPSVIPKQKIIKQDIRAVEGREVGFLV
jgi:hypothetical protein